ncbi:hypothetical protein EON65_40555 [archaeon]|nr:MAG: hypothetical protein EON65_40555 [archaeon]
MPNSSHDSFVPRHRGALHGSPDERISEEEQFLAYAQVSVTSLYHCHAHHHYLYYHYIHPSLRSHECEDEGYKWWHNGRTLTVFSAPNYCGVQRNKGAVVRFGDDTGVNNSQIVIDGDDGLPPPPPFKIVQFTEERKSKFNHRFAQGRVQQLLNEKRASRARDQ